jgi:hypothetical protein
VAVKRLRALDPNGGGSGGGGPAGCASSQSAVRHFFDREVAILASIRHPNVGL